MSPVPIVPSFNIVFSLFFVLLLILIYLFHYIMIWCKIDKMIKNGVNNAK
ncbi:hypothetical protein HMPREF1043_1213 [Streptococcus anginosus subsp. whileyi CCUG 39159]|uniref:Uncharacterized protein n=1 Tax=Streptococcus anginosus subsp. whileyi CCUG 39159 TaxID=1095729 RepID=I0SI45_STRAP|nr:hypothetical protein HMPREF1043_1213 [Streptococcus anginosus subsp. whileyi CCUG 39159]